MKKQVSVTVNQTNNVMRKKYLITSILVFLLLFFFQKQEVQAASMEVQSNTLNEYQVQELVMIQQKPAINYTTEELQLLATVIYAEAGGCDIEEQYRVGNVVLNRLEDTKHDEFKNVNTIENVIYQEGQFTSVGGEAWNRGPTETQIKIARKLLEGKRVLPDTVVWFSKKMLYGKKYYESEWHVFSGWPQEKKRNIPLLFSFIKFMINN